jgi:hypothetical protein
VSSCNVSFLESLSVFYCIFLVSYALISYSLGICLDPAVKDHQVFERVVALERLSSDTNTFWVDARHHSTIVLQQDRVQHVREYVDGCRKSLSTMYLLCFPGILLLRILASYSKFSGQADVFID